VPLAWVIPQPSLGPLVDAQILERGRQSPKMFFICLIYNITERVAALVRRSSIPIRQLNERASVL